MNPIGRHVIEARAARFGDKARQALLNIFDTMQSSGIECLEPETKRAEGEEAKMAIKINIGGFAINNFIVVSSRSKSETVRLQFKVLKTHGIIKSPRQVQRIAHKFEALTGIDLAAWDPSNPKTQRRPMDLPTGDFLLKKHPTAPLSEFLDKARCDGLAKFVRWLQDDMLRDFEEGLDFSTMDSEDSEEFDEGLPRGRTPVEVLDRTRQSEFRRAVMSRYEAMCVVSECDVDCALNAAHIVPAAEGMNDTPDNGIILRVDLHKLFDNHCLTIDSTGTVQLAPSIRNGYYRDIHGKSVRQWEKFKPKTRKALAAHCQEAQQKWTE